MGKKEKAKEAIFYSYTRHINGFAAILDDAEAAKISNHPQVVSVFLNKGKKLQTTRSWEFLGLEDNNGKIRPNSIWEKARFGQDTIIANIDGGVWPESKALVMKNLDQFQQIGKEFAKMIQMQHFSATGNLLEHDTSTKDILQL